jgi:repressor LexA
MSSSLTPRQADVLRLISEHAEVHGFPPTRNEICRALGFRSPNAAEEHLQALARKGMIELTPGVSRGIRLKQQAGVPVIGHVAAGSPILAAEHVIGRFQLDPLLFRPQADYLLRVRGMSMRDAGILDGDLLAVHRTGECRPGQIVVARIGDDVTVKRLQRHRHLVELVPENPAFDTITIDTRREEVQIEGIAVGVIRNNPPL